MNEVASALISHSSVTAPVAADKSPSSDELFIINLCTSMTPMPSVPKSLKGFEEFKLYQVSRVEDGRRRYRLRLGFFNCQAEAELLLSSVRAMYPAAFSGTASQEDLRFLGETPDAKKTISPKLNATPPDLPKTSPIKNTATVTTTTAPINHAIPVTTAPTKSDIAKSDIAPIRQPVTITSPSAAAPIPAASTKPQAGPGDPAKTKEDEATRIMKAPVRVRAAGKATALQVDAKALDTTEMSLEFEPTSEPGVPSAAVNARGEVKTLDSKPFHVGRGVTVPEVELQFAPEVERKAPAAAATPAKVSVSPKAAPQVAPLRAAAPPAVAKAAAIPPAGTMRSSVPAPSTNAPGKLRGAATVVDDYVPILDTTLTIRTLTQAEKDDPNQPKWYAVELASSEHPFNLEAMPRLDIFAAFSLYSVVVSETGKVRHALRLGFFREEVSADAVSGYLKTFFPSPVITRIGVAEYNRFAEPKPKAVAPAADQNVVKLSEKRDQAAPQVTGKPADKSVGAVAAKPAANAALRGNSSKNAQAAMNKGANKALVSESGIRQVARPQSFFARLIGRDLD